MQPLRISVVLTALAASAFAQVNPFVFYPQDPERQTITCTSFVGRPDWNRAAEALMEIDPLYFRGVSDSNGFTRIFGIYHWVADEKLTTVETYDLVIRDAAPGGGPDMTTAGLRWMVPGLTTPPSTNPNRGTWIMYDGFNQTGGVAWSSHPTYAPHFFVGVGLPANPQWPTTDGHSLFRADLLNANTGALLGENHRAGAPDPTWAGLQGAPSFSTPWTYILGPFVTSPNLHLGGVDPTSNRLGAPGANLSMNGMFPDVSGNPRSDGLIVRVTDNLAPFGWSFLGASLGYQTPFYLPGLYQTGFTLIGHSHIGDGFGPFGPIPLDMATLQNEVHEYTVALPGTIPTWMVGQHIVFQAVVFDANTAIANWTNAQPAYF